MNAIDGVVRGDSNGRAAVPQFDPAYWPAHTVVPPLVGPVRVTEPTVGLHGDHWLDSRPMFLRLSALKPIEEIVIRGHIPVQAETLMLLKLTINGTAYRNTLSAGSDFEWAIRCRFAAGNDIDIMLSGGRGFVPADCGLSDVRRLTVRLINIIFVPDPWAVRLTGPVSFLASYGAMRNGGSVGRGFSVEVQARRALRSVTVQGRVLPELGLPQTLNATVNGEPISRPVLPGLPFRWTIPCSSEFGSRISLTFVMVEESKDETSLDDAREAESSLIIERLNFEPDVRLPMREGGVVLSTILLSHNRPDLLRKTLQSYLSTISVPYEMIIVDNNSDDDTKMTIERYIRRNENLKAIMLTKNLGGVSMNFCLMKCRGSYIHISENDLEYLPDWDRELLTKLEIFPKLGQLSLSAPLTHDSTPWTLEGLTVHLARGNVITPSVSPRELYELGVRWTSHGNGDMLFPDDGRFSDSVKEHGYFVAWNDVNVVINHGFMIEEYLRRLPYYVASYLSKPASEGGIDALAGMLRAGGYRLEQDASGEWIATRLEKRPDDRSASDPNTLIPAEPEASAQPHVRGDATKVAGSKR